MRMGFLYGMTLFLPALSFKTTVSPPERPEQQCAPLVETFPIIMLLPKAFFFHSDRCVISVL